MSTPDLTKAQLLAVVKVLVALGAIFGLHLDATQAAEVLVAVVPLAGLLVHYDAAIRKTRAQNAGSLGYLKAASEVAVDTSHNQDVRDALANLLANIDGRVTAIEDEKAKAVQAVPAEQS